jgi:hypothetical protein
MPLEGDLGFTEQWFSLGIVTPEQLAAMRSEVATGRDPHTEHYRWRAFLAFADGIRQLDDELAISLYALGESDPDIHMGGSIMAYVLQRPECPETLVEKASLSDRSHLVKLAVRRRSRNT